MTANVMRNIVKVLYINHLYGQQLFSYNILFALGLVQKISSGGSSSIGKVYTDLSCLTDHRFAHYLNLVFKE